MIAAITDSTLWDVNDVASFLKMSSSWVYKRAEAGALPHLQIGGKLRFDPAAIRTWALGQNVAPARVVALTR